MKTNNAVQKFNIGYYTLYIINVYNLNFFVAVLVPQKLLKFPTIYF